ncbi:hypothetical protein B7P43_G14280 [Cryptotermes secundus]|uniref:Maelstrom domain-containing protein n=1 Tax=Cryptotermes secundus TaxID=105785 RepID=A0A2J7RPD0_9NEOP|nr:hypothetical protein B7P43_G14280 [Cryptotermes secundus]
MSTASFAADLPRTVDGPIQYNARTVFAYRTVPSAGSTVALPASLPVFAADCFTTAPQIERPDFDTQSPGSSLTVVSGDTAASEHRMTGNRFPAATCVRPAPSAGSTVALPSSLAIFAGHCNKMSSQIELPGFDAQGPWSSVTVVSDDTEASEHRRFLLCFAILETKTATGTHLFPLPPDGESEHQKIYANIRLFLMGEDADETNLPLLYTGPGDFEDVENILWHLNEHRDQHRNEGRDKFRVYSVCNLFHELRNASVGVPSEVVLPPNFLDEHELINEGLEFTEGISCDFHEELETML